MRYCNYDKGRARDGSEQALGDEWRHNHAEGNEQERRAVLDCGAVMDETCDEEGR